MSKKWAECYSSEEGSADEADLVSDDETSEISPSTTDVNINKNNDTPEQNSDQNVIQISDINFASSREDVGRFFEDAGCKIVKFDLLKNPNGRSKGMGVMQFQDSDSVRIGLELHGKVLAGRAIKVRVFDEAAKFQTHNDQQLFRKPTEYSRSKDKGMGNNRERLGFKGDKNRSDEINRKGASQNASVQKSSGSGVENPPVRPKLNLQPRTLPVDTIGAKLTKPTIFGEGRAHDEAEYERAKGKDLQSTQASGSHSQKPSDESVFRVSTLSAAVETAQTDSTVPDKTQPEASMDTPKQSAPVEHQQQKRSGGKGTDDVGRAAQGSHKGRDASRAGLNKHEKPADSTRVADDRSKAGKLSHSNKLFNAALQQTSVSDSAAVRKEPRPTNGQQHNRNVNTVKTTQETIQLTDEEKFNRAQKRVTGERNIQEKSAVNKAKVGGGFAALGGDESD